MRNAVLKYGLVGLAALAAGAIAAPAVAAQIAATSYDTPNGDGQASGGSFNYWDLAYSGAGATSTDGAALTGGQGDLTDGVIASSFWFNVENAAGTGPYVGWYQPVTSNPAVTFHFAGSPTITDIKVYLDNSGSGGVFSPASILIDGVNTPFTAPAGGTIGVIDFSGLSLTGGSHTLEFDQRPGTWTFVSEVSFFGAAVPEPGAWALMLVGFGGLGVALRSMRRTPSTV